MIAQSPPSPPPTAPAERIERQLRHPLLILRLHPEDDRRTFFGYATRLGPTGLRIDATKPRPVGERYRLEIPLPSPLEGTVECECEVVWSRDWARHVSPGMGLEFVDLPSEVQAALAAWIENETFEDLMRVTGTG